MMVAGETAICGAEGARPEAEISQAKGRQPDRILERLSLTRAPKGMVPPTRTVSLRYKGQEAECLPVLFVYRALRKPCRRATESP